MILRVLFSTALLFLATSAMADTYVCTALGKKVFQDTPCGQSAQHVERRSATLSVEERWRVRCERNAEINRDFLRDVPAFAGHRDDVRNWRLDHGLTATDEVVRVNHDAIMYSRTPADAYTDTLRACLKVKNLW